MRTGAAPAASRRRTARLASALGVNVALVVAEVAAGTAAHSTALLADAGHNLSDVAAIGLSLAAVRWALRPRSAARTYGNHRATILAALANAALLAVVTCAVAALGALRLAHPSGVHGTLVAAVGAAALVVNGLAALVLRERGNELNMRSAFVHMAADAAASAVVVVAGVVVAVVGPRADLADPAASLAVAAIILVEAVRIMRASADVLLESTPGDVDLGEVRATVTTMPGVDEVHDLHVWSLSSEYRALSAHLVLTGHPTLEEAQAIGADVRTRVGERFGIAHTTFEMECERCEADDADPCGVDAPLDAHRTGVGPDT